MKKSVLFLLFTITLVDQSPIKGHANEVMSCGVMIKSSFTTEVNVRSTLIEADSISKSMLCRLDSIKKVNLLKLAELKIQQLKITKQ